MQNLIAYTPEPYDIHGPIKFIIIFWYGIDMLSTDSEKNIVSYYHNVMHIIRL